VRLALRFTDPIQYRYVDDRLPKNVNGHAAGSTMNAGKEKPARRTERGSSCAMRSPVIV
jgi:hypothetical protein